MFPIYARVGIPATEPFELKYRAQRDSPWSDSKTFERQQFRRFELSVISEGAAR